MTVDQAAAAMECLDDAAKAVEVDQETFYLQAAQAHAVLAVADELSRLVRVLQERP